MWLPLLWIGINGYLLGSPTLRQEVLIAIAGALIWFAVPYTVFWGLESLGAERYKNASIPYLQIAMQGVFFLTLYLIAFKQMVPYQLHQYLQERNKT